MVHIIGRFGHSMMVFLDYISSIRRLNSVNKHIQLMGTDVPDQILMQRDFIQLEKDYYQEQSLKYTIIIALLLCAIGVYLLIKGILL